jgi:diguanylate cyclase (GGDEF)-like protein
MATGDRDHLTQLSTRAEFDHALREVCSSATTDQPAGLILADIDHFKKVNDTHGHQTGDQVLTEMGRLLALTVEGKGHAYRYGGEEFAMLLPNHTADEALSVAERFRRSAEASPLAGLPITCSCGVAIAPAQATEEEAWLKKADDALYDAKNLGRNLVRLSGEAPPKAPQRARRLSCKPAQPGVISDEAREELRLSILRDGTAACPIDNIPLDARDVTTIGESGRSFMVRCPGCGFNTCLPGPNRR